MPAPKPRGIINNGSTCYIAAALQVLFHGLPSLVTWVLSPQFPRTDDSSEQQQRQQQYWHELRRILAKLYFGAAFDSPDAPVDASQFYQAMMLNWNGDNGISEIDEEGDAVFILNLILRELENKHKTCLLNNNDNNNSGDDDEESPLKSICGSYIQTIRTFDVNVNNSNQVLLESRSKERMFCGCPFPLTMVGHHGGDSSLEDVMLANTCAAQIISQSSGRCEDDVVNANTRMEKTVQFKDLPEHLLLHLKRFDYDLKEGGVKKVLQPMNVSMKLNMEPYLHTDNDNNASVQNRQLCSYELKCAIVHSGREATHGHYICYVRTNTDQWMIIDDDAVRVIASTEEMCSILSGRSGECFDGGDDMPQSAMLLVYHQIKENEHNIQHGVSIEEVLFAHGLTDDAELIQMLLRYYANNSFAASAPNDQMEERKLTSLLWLDLVPRRQWDNVAITSQLIAHSSSLGFFDFFQSMNETSLQQALIALVDDQTSQTKLAEMLEVMVSKSTNCNENVAHTFKALSRVTTKLVFDDVNYGAADVGVKMIGSVLKAIHVTDEWLSYVFDLVRNDDFVTFVKANHHREILAVFRYCIENGNDTSFDQEFCIFLQSLICNRRSRSDVMKFISDIELAHERPELICLSLAMLHLDCRKVILCLANIDDELRPVRMKSIIKYVSETSSIEKEYELPILVARLLKRWHVAEILRSDENLRQQFIDFVRCELKYEGKEDYDAHYKLLAAASSSKDEYEEHQSYDSDDEPSDILNKRLSIRWSKGKWYDGVVSEYDDDDGKHTVLYDDGDERRYNLKKKSVRFLLA